MSLSTWSTRRTTHKVLDDGPLRHAVRAHQHPVGRRTGRAVCGAQIARYLDNGWDPAHDRACPKCRAQA